MSALHVDWTRCDGHGACAELLPELITQDQWGFPMPHRREDPRDDITVTDALTEHALHAVDACPVLALSLRRPRRR